MDSTLHVKSRRLIGDQQLNYFRKIRLGLIDRAANQNSLEHFRWPCLDSILKRRRMKMRSGVIPTSHWKLSTEKARSVFEEDYSTGSIRLFGRLKIPDWRIFSSEDLIDFFGAIIHDTPVWIYWRWKSNKSPPRLNGRTKPMRTSSRCIDDCRFGWFFKIFCQLLPLIYGHCKQLDCLMECLTSWQLLYE